MISIEIRVMNKITIFSILFFLVVGAKAQTNKAELLAEINRDIWIVFLNGVNNNNPAMYNSVHSKDFYWVMEGIKTRIMNFEEYVEDAAKVMKDRETKGIKTFLDIRFTERNINNEFASERCVIKFVSAEPHKNPVESYGYTHVFSRRENGVWKKVVQYVMTEAATKEVFENAAPVE
jgi:hypothetical protein